MKWLVLTQTVTSKGNPREFAVHLDRGDLDPKRWHMIAAERVGGGGDDANMPRRAVGMGLDRASARRSLEETISAYDPSGTIVFAR